MKTRERERAIQIVREVIHRWDPYELLRAGCPSDEFEHEIAAVTAQLPRIRSPTDAAHALSRVFSSAFEPHRFSPDDCVAAGADLYAALSAQQLMQ